MLIEPVNKTLYRTLLPEQFDLPDTLQASAFVVHYQNVFPWPMTSYLEGALFLKCLFNDREFWFTYTMPVTKYIPMWGGRMMGFPKYVADNITLEGGSASCEGTVIHKEKKKMNLRFELGLKSKPGPSEEFITNLKTFFLGTAINVLPPSTGSKVVMIQLHHQIEPKWNPAYGMVRIDCSEDEIYRDLFDAEREYFGFYNEFEGGINLDPHRL